MKKEKCVLFAPVCISECSMEMADPCKQKGFSHSLLIPYIVAWGLIYHNASNLFRLKARALWCHVHSTHCKFTYSSMTAPLEGGECSAARPGRTLPQGKTRYPLYRRLGGPQGRSGRTENLVPTGIRSRTVQPIVSCYTN